MKTLCYISVGLQIYPYKRNDTCSFHISWSSCLSEQHGSIQMSMQYHDQGGKTTFTRQFIKYANVLFERPVHKIVYCYGQ